MDSVIGRRLTVEQTTEWGDDVRGASREACALSVAARASARAICAESVRRREARTALRASRELLP